MSEKKKKNSFDSREYWSNRYENGGNSGAGSYGRLAQYKADFVNKLVTDESISNVIEFGSGDGNQCSMFEIEEYTGIDVSMRAVKLCNQRYTGKRPIRNFFHADDPAISNKKAPLVMSLDVIFHLIEDDVFNRYMETLFNASTKRVLIYSSNEEQEVPVEHVRHRRYTDWIEYNRPDFIIEKEEDNPYPYQKGIEKQTSFASFKLFVKKEGA